jgi:hypothetical protein
MLLFIPYYERANLSKFFRKEEGILLRDIGRSAAKG